MERNQEKIVEQPLSAQSEENRKTYYRGVAAGIAGSIAVLAIIFVLRSYFWLGVSGTEGPDSSHAKIKIRTMQELIEKNYLQPVDEEKLTQGMYAGLVAALEDPYSAYYSKDRYREVTQSNKGTYEGIGVTLELDPETKIVTIQECVEDGAAEKAGIKKGDILLTVDGTDVRTLTLSEISTLIRQTKAETVQLQIQRGEETLNYTVEKQEIILETVEADLLDGGIGVMKITQFKGVTPDQFREAYEMLEEQGMQKLLIDLRDNPGGLLNAVCDTLDQILPKGLIVYTEDKDGKREEYKSSGKTPLDIPMVVLVNENSASAAEIFAGAVQDYGIGTLVGTTTFGKGIVQKSFEFPDHSALKITVSHYYTPKGNDIHQKGIEPEITVTQPENAQEDVQFQKALEVLREK